MQAELRKKLAGELGEVDWQALKGHYKRQAVVIVDNSLDLVEVGTKMAMDDKLSFQRWLATGQVYKPDDGQAENWQEHNSPFMCLIIEPFILAQPIT